MPRTINSIKIKDMLVYDEFEEFLKAYSTREESKELMELIVEYYKYHSEIPRLFMMVKH